MAETALTVKKGDWTDGLAMTESGDFVAPDAVNGNSFDNSSGKVRLVILGASTAGGSTGKVTFNAVHNCPFGKDHAPETDTGHMDSDDEILVIGRFPKKIFGSTVTMTWAGALTDVLVAAIDAADSV